MGVVGFWGAIIKIMNIDLLLYNAGQLCTIPAQNGQPQRGTRLGELGIIENGAVAVHEGKIIAVGTSDELQTRYNSKQSINARGHTVIPGFVDPHTHLVWVGDRAGEFEMRIGGASYMDIMNAGGGINNTVRHVRAAPLEQIVEETRARLDRMLKNGTTTVEIKTGYGLDTQTELKQLQAIYTLAAEHPARIVATFLGAHAVPPEYKDKTDIYVELVIDEMLPAVVHFSEDNNQPLPFVDVFCEERVFNVEQTRRILEAAQKRKMPLKIHADEFAGLGGTKLAVELGAVSADHLVSTPDEDIQALGKGNTIAVALPPTPFGLAHPHYTPARKIIAAGGALALATDCNPGTAWCESMQFVMALACRYLKLTPAEALVAATLNSAFAIGCGHETGSLEVGKSADMLILDTNDYRHLAYRFGGNLAQTVIKSGQMLAL